ncbi:molybdopterin molybdochelatase /molybdenum cofactor cytidylyltransferase [Faunimonas pinastri]|uniref:Molybdopterin molybdochelatase /molybdenum cofactor cytidylyltransferase n=1 Tax=Faunimonas pinastri TaxID=1855383 RepID=A0A1H9D4I2_9HYPH|nr:molybdopterin-binding/glycosyltransferase family 2 protein [Faunimonas pinastri]SEQ07743.1 molybdopterin molybdochelatase /molybdenum cofactor cytidylyltransferase [Faunimonas pinastri]
MKFGLISVAQADGAILAHSIRLASGVLRKGTRLGREALRRLAEEGHTEIVVARLAPTDISEDEAAAAIANLLVGANVRRDLAGTGRCNLFAERAGVFQVDRAAIDALNRLDPGITVATLPEFAAVEAGRMIATVKIIPFAVPAAALVSARGTLDDGVKLAVAPFQPLRVGLAATILPGLKPTVMEKTRRALEDRLRPAGATLTREIRVPHEPAALASALRSLREDGADLLIAFGASAITDQADVIPDAIGRAGGSVRHFGMPVDPGNLLLVGDLAGAVVLGAPGCARSPRENGFDWVLNRLLAGIPVTSHDLTGMGVGGLLMDIVSRPQPREGGHAPSGKTAIVILAAGQARRMGGPNKLLATFQGVPLVRRIAEAARHSSGHPVFVVTGHMEAEIRATLAGLDVQFAHNPDYAEGLGTSVRTGIAALPEDCDGALVTLADMPGVTTELIDRLLAAFGEADGPAIVLPTVDGKRGNPVLWSSHFFGELRRLTGDTGARHLLAEHGESIVRIEVGEAAAIDVDTPDALHAAGGTLPEAAGQA